LQRAAGGAEKRGVVVETEHRTIGSEIVFLKEPKGNRGEGGGAEILPDARKPDR